MGERIVLLLHIGVARVNGLLHTNSRHVYDAPCVHLNPYLYLVV